MADSPRSVEWSVRVYRTLLKAYPATFRKGYGDEMALVFREHLVDSRRRRGTAGLIAAWFRVLCDVAWTVPEEHFHEIERSMNMKSVGLAILSVFLAAVIYVTVFYGIAVITLLPLLPLAVDISRLAMELLMITLLYLSAFLTGLMLTRVKPFFAPRATVPVATVMIWGIGSLSVFLENRSPDRDLGWGVLALHVGLVASAGVVAFLGCVVAARTSIWLARFSVRWYHLVGPLAVLTCTSFVACVLRLMLLADQVGADLQRILTICWFALLGAGALMTAHIVFLFVRSYKGMAVE